MLTDKQSRLLSFVNEQTPIIKRVIADALDDLNQDARADEPGDYIHVAIATLKSAYDRVESARESAAKSYRESLQTRPAGQG